MEIKITKLTNASEAQLACSYTANRGVHPSLEKLYLSRHSPIYTQIFRIEFINVPLEVRDHLTRHHEGVSWYFRTHRDDRSGEPAETVNYDTLTSGMCIINAGAIINISALRLCGKAHPKTRAVWQEVKNQMKEVDKELFVCMVPQCENRGKLCYEFSGCGLCPNVYAKYDKRLGDND